jgi:phospholipid transport system substrate-binding protein
MNARTRRLAAPFAALALTPALLGGAAAVSIGVVASLLAPAPASAQARDAQAEAFVTAQSQRALNILNNRALSQGQKAAQFRSFVDQAADVPRITNFVLGKYNRTITPAQRAQFTQVFREYASNVYETRLDEYKGERFQVTGSQVRKAGSDVVVTSLVSGGQMRQPQTVRWRVIRGPAGWRVVDVEVLGVWLAITQQQDFVATIDNAGGNINALISQLRAQTQARRG